jgi:hypothetical protein
MRADQRQRWFCVRINIDDRYGRAMFNMDVAVWDAEDDLRDSITAERVGA